MSLRCQVCAVPATELHHVVTQQQLRRLARSRSWSGGTFADLRSDTRNMIPLCDPCHDRTHTRQQPLLLADLPGVAFTFACEVMGPGPAYEYLSRTYGGQDERLNALLTVVNEEAA